MQYEINDKMCKIGACTLGSKNNEKKENKML